MKTIQIMAVPEQTWSSPGGKFCLSGRGLSEALGRDATSLDLSLRHPFDVEIQRVPAGALAWPYHSHSAQWEFYIVIAGSGTVRHADGIDRVVTGDAFLFKPGEPHQINNDGNADLVFYVIADNPIGETVYFEDTKRWSVRSPRYQLVREDDAEYFTGEE